MALLSYYDMTITEVISHARQILGAMAELPAGSADHSALTDSYESAMNALKHKIFLLNIQLGLEPVVVPDGAVSWLVSRKAPGKTAVDTAAAGADTV